ncbi:unnamed protein product [Protopolystoma xenopodis]|uniref:Malonyl-CoA:ACP transacylase (MAT) domain-containing protein n=1 Tax=Protopolystoma xenopodis TaxID=117903 RepID=A0A3S5FDX0_9PLAT|nr:unnamed protein product [Protopolystoma xenopodis]
MISIPSTSILLFPGQGSQFVGMAKKLLYLPKVKEMFEYAGSILRTNLMKKCTEGPLEELTKTVHCQPAIYITSLAAAFKLRTEDPKLVENCVAVAGFSSGEIAALVFAGSLTFEEGLSLIQTRSQAMQSASTRVSGGMASIFLSHSSQLSSAITAAKSHYLSLSRKQTNQSVESSSRYGDLDDFGTDSFEPQCVCQTACYLYADCKVIAGHIEVALDFIEAHLEQFRLVRMKHLPVSGAFHTPLMAPARLVFTRALDRVPGIKMPSIPVLSNVDALPYTSVSKIKVNLSKQITTAVRWEQILHSLYSRPLDASFPRTIEVGPGRQLGSMLRMVNRKAFMNYHSIEV